MDKLSDIEQILPSSAAGKTPDNEGALTGGEGTIDRTEEVGMSPEIIKLANKVEAAAFEAMAAHGSKAVVNQEGGWGVLVHEMHSASGLVDIMGTTLDHDGSSKICELRVTYNNPENGFCFYLSNFSPDDFEALDTPIITFLEQTPEGYTGTSRSSEKQLEAVLAVLPDPSDPISALYYPPRPMLTRTPHNES